jgi:hypothetical protein
MKQLLSAYSVSGSVVTLTGVNRPRESVLSITNATTGAILYTAQTGGATAYTQATNSTITLSTAPGASDRLQIFYDDGVANNSVTTNNAATQVYNYTATGAVSNYTVIISPIDCGQIREISVQLVSAGVGFYMTAQISNNNTNWVAAPFVNSGGTVSSGSSVAVATFYNYQVFGAKFFRIQQTANQTSGTTTLVAYASQQATPKLYQTVTIAGSTAAIPTQNASTGFGVYHTLISAASTNATSVKNGAGTIGTLVLTNNSASVKYVKFFNLATAPTMGTSTPVIQFPIQANSTLDASMSFAGLRLSTGIAYAITGGSDLLDNTAVGAGEVLVNLSYV